MKILVDKIPEKSAECLFSERLPFYAQYPHCSLNGNYCRLNSDERCPFLVEIDVTEVKNYCNRNVI